MKSPLLVSLLTIFSVSHPAPSSSPSSSSSSSCLSHHHNSSSVRISPLVLAGVLAGAGPHCHHCFTLLQDGQPVLQVGHHQQRVVWYGEDCDIAGLLESGGRVWRGVYREISQPGGESRQSQVLLLSGTSL